MPFWIPALGAMALMSLLSSDSKNSDMLTNNRNAQKSYNAYGAGRIPQPPGIQNNSPQPAQNQNLPGMNNMFSNLNNQLPPTSEIFSRLQSLSDPSQYRMDPAYLQQQAQAAANAQYDPVTANLQNQMNISSQRADRNKGYVGAMFNGLSDNLQQDVPKINQTFDNTKQKVAGEYNQLQSSIQGQYADTQKAQEDLFNRLGIQAAQSDVAPRQAKDQSFFENMARSAGQAQQDALGLQQTGATDFTNRGSQIARTEGTQRQADITNQLNDLLQGYQGQIGANEQAKNQSYIAGLGSLYQQANQFAVNEAQRQTGNYTNAINTGRNLVNDQWSHMNLVNSTHSSAQVGARAITFGLPFDSAQKIQNVFSGAVMDPYIQHGIDPSTGQNASNQAKAAKIVQMGQQQGLSQPEMNALQAIALEYFQNGG